MNSGGSLVGQQLGNYLIQEPLGRGGMARVYKGIDTMLKRPVAIKVIEESLRSSSSYAQRFEREAQAVANLRHPNIVNVFYFGVQDNLYYLVMEYIDGTDLDAILRNYGQNNELMPYSDVMRILETVASALDYAHGQGVIHRDVKPSNIMLERNGRPVLTDFGLALKVSEGTAGDTFGTPHYISPEQARSSANVVPQSDLYSLAVVAYELLAGVPPFDDPSATALAMQHLMAAVPSARYFNPQLAPDVDTVLFKALAKTPEERYASGAELCAALRQGLEITMRSVNAPPTQLPEPPANFESPPPRRLSMQTAVDKVDQELALQQSKGQAMTRAAESSRDSTWQRVKSGNWLPYIVATGAAAMILVIFALVISSNSGSETAVPTATEALTSVVAAQSTIEPRATNTILPTEAPTNTLVPTTEPTGVAEVTLVEVAASPEPPTLIPSTPIPPTPIPPTSIPFTTEPPTTAPVLPTDPPVGATSAPGDWLPVTFVYNGDGFWWLNGASRSINVTPIRFERVGGSQAFNGSLWAYWTLESGRCMELRFSDVGNPARPNSCRPNAFFTPTRTQGIDFWTGSGQFRVLWNGTEIAVCEIAAGQCSAAVPPA